MLFSFLIKVTTGYPRLMQMNADHFSADPFRSYEFVRLRTKGLNKYKFIVRVGTNTNCTCSNWFPLIGLQLKHASRYVHDLLTVLTKHMDMPSILYLLDLVSKLPPTAHTRQTLYLASVLIRIVWRAGLTSAVAEAGPSVHTTSPVHGPLTSG